MWEWIYSSTPAFPHSRISHSLTPAFQEPWLDSPSHRAYTERSQPATISH